MGCDEPRGHSCSRGCSARGAGVKREVQDPSGFFSISNTPAGQLDPRGIRQLQPGQRGQDLPHFESPAMPDDAGISLRVINSAVHHSHAVCRTQAAHRASPVPV